MIVSILMHNFLHRHNPSAKSEQKGSWGTRDGGFPQLRFCTVLTWLMDGWNIRQREFAPDVARASLKISWLHSGGALTIRGLGWSQWYSDFFAVFLQKIWSNQSFKTVMKPFCCVLWSLLFNVQLFLVDVIALMDMLLDFEVAFRRARYLLGYSDVWLK